MYVYQYTDWNAVKNIIKTNRLWATDYHHLNDSSEIYYGIELIIDAIAKEKFLSKKEAYQLKDEVFKFMDKLGIYISSLCLIEDDLSMWRTYGNCAVVMDKSITTLGITTEGSFRQNSILSCHYPKSFEDLDIVRNFSTLSYLFDTYCFSDKREWFISSLIYDATSIKHYGFYAENEHRAVVSVNDSDSTEVKERLIGDVKKPYIELVLPNGAIHGVYVGPSKEQSKLVDEISVFLEENKRTDIKIYQSKIPYVG